MGTAVIQARAVSLPSNELRAEERVEIRSWGEQGPLMG